MSETSAVRKLFAISQTDLIWKIRRLAASLERNSPSTPQVTLEEYIAEKNLDPIWRNHSHMRGIILEMLVALAKPELDEGSLDIAALDIDPRRRVLSVEKGLRNLVGVICKRQRELATKLGLDAKESITAERADAIEAEVAAEGISADQFRGAAEQAYLTLLTRTLLDQALALAEQFSPQRGRSGAVFNPADIPEDYRLGAIDNLFHQYNEALGRDESVAEGLALGKRLLALGLLPTEAFQRCIISRIRSHANMYGKVDAALQEYVGVLVGQTEVKHLVDERIRYALLGIEEPSDFSSFTDRDVEELQADGIPVEQLRASVVLGHLHKLRTSGAAQIAKKTEPRWALLAGVTDLADLAAKEREALADYTEGLFRSQYIDNDPWIALVKSHKGYFREGRYQAAVFAAVYKALNGYHKRPEFAEKVRAEFADLDWEAFASFQPPSYAQSKEDYSYVDVRALVTSKLHTDREQRLAKILFDWLGVVIDRAESIDTHVTWVRQAVAESVGLAREKQDGFVSAFFSAFDKHEIAQGNTTQEKLAAEKAEEERRQGLRVAQVLQTFGGELAEAPYFELVKVRRTVAEVLRELGHEIEDGYLNHMEKWSHK